MGAIVKVTVAWMQGSCRKGVLTLGGSYVGGLCGSPTENCVDGRIGETTSLHASKAFSHQSSALSVCSRRKFHHDFTHVNKNGSEERVDWPIFVSETNDVSPLHSSHVMLS